MQSLGVERGFIVDGLTKAQIIDLLNSIHRDDVVIGAGASQIEAADEDAFDVEGNMGDGDDDEEEEVQLGGLGPTVRPQNPTKLKNGESATVREMQLKLQLIEAERTAERERLAAERERFEMERERMTWGHRTSTQPHESSNVFDRAICNLLPVMYDSDVLSFFSRI